MSRSRKAFTACVIASAAALAAASALGRAWALIPLPPAIGVLWIFSRARQSSMAASVHLSILVCSSGACVLAGLSPALALAASCTSLAAWDLDRFSRTVEGATAGEALRRSEQLHLLRLMAVCGTGGLAGLLSLLVHLRVGFAALLATGVLLAAGLAALVRLLRSS